MKKSRIVFILMLLSCALKAQLTLTSGGSLVEVRHQSQSLTSMSAAVNYRFDFTNQTATSQTGTLTVQFPSEFNIAMVSTAEVVVTNVSGNTFDLTYTLAPSIAASITYQVQSCHLNDFGNDLFKTRNILYSTSSPSLALSVPSQTITVNRGMSLTPAPAVATDNQQTYQYEGDTYERRFSFTSNGSTGALFTGFISYSDNLGASLSIVDLWYSVNNGPRIQLAPTNSAGVISADFSVSNIAVGANITVIERVYISGCILNGNTSSVQVTWSDGNPGICPVTLPQITPTVSRFATPYAQPILYASQYPANVLDYCYDTDIDTPTTSTTVTGDPAHGEFVCSKSFTNDRPDNRLENVSFMLSYDEYSMGNVTKRPLSAVRFVRSNPTVPGRNFNYSFAALSGVSDNATIATFLQQYSSVNSLIGGYSYYHSFTENVVNNVEAPTCSNQPAHFMRLIFNRIPDPANPGSYLSLDFMTGDTYQLVWLEEQCCGNIAAALQTDRYSRNGWCAASMAYPLCGEQQVLRNISNGEPDGGPWGYWRTTENSEVFLPNTTKILNGNPDRNNATRDGEIGEVHIEHIYGSWMGYNYTYMNANTTSLHIDILLENGLSMNLSNDINLPPVYEVELRYKNGAVAPSGTTALPLALTLLPAMDANNLITSLDNPLITTPVVAGEHYTIVIPYTQLVAALGMTNNLTIGNVTSEISKLELFFRVKAVSCPPKAKIAVRNFAVFEGAGCATCRNLMSRATFDMILHCPGCVIPGPSLNTASFRRADSSMGQIDNNNDGIPDAAPGADQRLRNLSRLGDLMEMRASAVFSDGDNALGGFTYSDLLAQRPEYILSNAYLRTTFGFGSGYEISKVEAILHRGTSHISKILLDIPGGVAASPGRIMMHGAGGLEDYTNVGSSVGYKVFLFLAKTQDFFPADADGYNHVSLGGQTDEIEYIVHFRINQEIVAPDNIEEVHYLVYTAKEDNTFSPGTAGVFDVGSTCDVGPCVTPASLPADNSFFWCQGYESIFGFVRYTNNTAYYLNDANYGGGVPACEKNLIVRSETYALHISGAPNYNPFPNEYRVVNHPESITMELPPGYVLTSSTINNYNGHLNIGEVASVTPASTSGNTVVYNIPINTVPQATGGNVTSISPFDDLAWMSLTAKVTSDCALHDTPEMVVWSNNASVVPAAIHIAQPIVKSPTIPVTGLAVPIGQTTDIITANNIYPTSYGDMIIFKPQTDITLSRLDAEVLTVSQGSIDFDLRVTNSRPKDGAGNIKLNPHSNEPLNSTTVSHTWLDFNPLPTGLIIDRIQKVSDNSFVLADANNLFDLGEIPANSTRDFIVFAHYDCTISGCNPASLDLQNCMNQALARINYNWTCNSITSLNQGCQDVKFVDHKFTNSPVLVNVVTANSNINACTDNIYTMDLQSLNNGAISGYNVTVNLPTDVQYIPNSASFTGGISVSETVSPGSVVLSVSGLNSSINNNFNNSLSFSYSAGCTSGNKALSGTVNSISYCSSLENTPFNSTVSVAAVPPVITLSNTACSSGSITVDYNTSGDTFNGAIIYEIKNPTTGGILFTEQELVSLSAASGLVSHSFTSPFICGASYLVEAHYEGAAVQNCSNVASACTSSVTSGIVSCTFTRNAVSLTVSSDQNICANQTANLVADVSGNSGHVNFEWISNPGNVVLRTSGYAPSTHDVYAYTGASAQISVTATDVSGCSDTKQIAVTVIPGPVVNFDVPSEYCFGSVVHLVGTPSGGTFSGVGVSFVSGQYYFSGTIAAPHQITYAYTDPVTGCSNSITKEVNPTGCCPYVLRGASVMCGSNEEICVTLEAIRPVSAGIKGMDFTLKYNPAIMTPVGPPNASSAIAAVLGPVVINGSLTSANASYAMSVVPSTGTLHVSIFYTSSSPSSAQFVGVGDVICVKFRMNGAATSALSGTTQLVTIGDMPGGTFNAGFVDEEYTVPTIARCVENNGQAGITILQDMRLRGILFYHNLTTGSFSDRLRYDAANPATYLPTDIVSANASCTQVSPSAVRPDVNGQFEVNMTGATTLNINRDIAGDFSTPAGNCVDASQVINQNTPTVLMSVFNGFDSYLMESITTFRQPSAVAYVNNRTVPGITSPAQKNANFPTAYQMIAADVNMNDIVRANDITLVQQRSVGTICEYPQQWNYGNNPIPSNIGLKSLDWRFTNINQGADPTYSRSTNYPDAPIIVGRYWRDNVPPVSTCLTMPAPLNACVAFPATQNIYSVLLGDLDGSWRGNPGGQQSTLKTASARKVIIDYENINRTGANTYRVPVLFDSDETVVSLDFALDYNEAKLKVLGVGQYSGSSDKDARWMFNDWNQTHLMLTSYTMNNYDAGVNLYYVDVMSIDGTMSPAYFGSGDAYLNGVKETLLIKGLATDVVEENKSVSGFEVIPNPTDGNGEITYTMNFDQNASIRVYNNLGQVVANYTDLTGSGSISLETLQLSNGVYQAVLYVGAEQLVKKFVVSK